MGANRLKTRELLELEPDAFSTYVRQMSAKECEKHLRKLLKKLHGPAIEDYLEALQQFSTPSDGAPAIPVERYLPETSALFPEHTRDKGLVAIVLVIGLQRIARRLEKTRDAYQSMLRK